MVIKSYEGPRENERFATPTRYNKWRDSKIIKTEKVFFFLKTSLMLKKTDYLYEI